VRSLLLFTLLLACAPTEPETTMNRYALAAASVAGFWSATGGTISPTGLYHADTVPGVYAVAYDSAGLHAEATVNVCAFAGLEVTPDSAAGLTVGDTVQVNGALETNCLTADTSITVFWESRDEAVATVVATGTQRGRITAVAAGETWVIGRDSLSTRFDSVYVCVQDYYLTDVAPATATIAIAGTQALTGTTTNCGAADAGAVVTWTSRTPSVATVLTSGNQTATVTGVALGTAYIVGEKSPGGADSMLVTVTGPCTPGALTFTPGENYQTKVTAAASGASFTFCNATYPFFTVVPKSGQTFRGDPSTPGNVILSGGRQLTAWTASGSTWYAAGQTQQNTDKDTRTCQSDHPGCNLPEQLWVDGTLYERMTSLAAVGAGKWYFDYAADRIYVSVNPSGKTIITSVTPQAFSGSATGVTVKGVTVQHYATGSGRGTIDAKAGWIVDSLVVGDNNATCIRVSGNTVKVRLSRAHHCGEQGIGGPARLNLLVYRNEIDHNNTAGFGPGGGDNKSSGLKVSGTTDMIIRRNNVHDNEAIGLWCDISCVNSTYDSNTITNNARRGIQHEISYGCDISYNTVTGNASDDSGLSAAGIWIAQSTDCDVHDNTLSGNPNGIVGTDRERGTGTEGLYLLSGLIVRDNTITQTTGTAVGVQDQATSRDPYSGAANNDNFSGNSYTCTSSTRWYWSGASKTKAQWAALFPSDGGYSGC
jgi:parallel beta-helix repeat protein